MKNIITVRISNFVKYVIIALGLFLITNVTYAQSHGKKGPPPIPDNSSVEKMVDNLALELELSKDQKSKVSNLYTEHFDLMRQMAEESKVTGKKASRKAMETIKSDFESNVKAFLTKEQQIKYDEYIIKMKNYWENRPSHKSGSKPNKH